MRDIHYGIIGFVGIVLGLVYFLIENLCFTFHCFLLEIIKKKGKTNHQYKELASFSPKSYLLICNYVRKRRDWLSSGNPILMETIGFVFFFFRGWQGQPVGQSTRPSTQPTGLARQLRQSARSTAHCDKIRETKKQKTKQKPTHGQKLGSCIISILIETISFSVYCFFSFRGLTWPASWPVRLAIHSANSGPTGLASQLRQSARSTAHFREIRKIRKPKNQHMYRNLEAVAYPFWVTG